MAHSSKLTKWLLANTAQLKLRATKFDWVRPWGLHGYYDFEVSIEAGGRAFIGRGTDEGEELAFLKAGAEAIERAYCAGHEIHSVGVAVHTSDQLAIESARSELIERDAFFCHFYSNTPFVFSPGHLKELESRYGQVFRELSRHGVQYGLYEAKSEDQPVFIFVASGLSASLPFGGVIGLGSDESGWRAISSAFMECARNVAAIASAKSDVPTHSEAEFRAVQTPTSIDRQQLARNTEYWKGVQHLFPAVAGHKSASIRTVMEGRSKQGISTTESRLTCPFVELADAPIAVYRASLHEKYGTPLEKSVPTTLARICEFTGQTTAAIERRPHFLG